MILYVMICTFNKKPITMIDLEYLLMCTNTDIDAGWREKEREKEIDR